MKPKQPMLTIMVALNCEAKPWVDLYRLKKVCDRPFLMYSKEGLNVEIVITGIGALAMSTAVGWAAGRRSSGETDRVWLNLGIAGHMDRPLGEAVRVHCFIDASDLRRHYSPLTASWGGDSDALISVNAPGDSYPDDAMVDMEGLAFYQATSMFTPSELIASIKVISDNSENNVEDLNASKITQLMRAHLESVNRLGDSLMVLSEERNRLIDVRPIELALPRMRITHSQQQQLDRLLEQASVLELHDAVSEVEFSRMSRVDQVLSALESLLSISAPLIDHVSSLNDTILKVHQGDSDG